MPFQLLDLILAGIMIISGLLALMRGFTREVLSLIAWGAAAVAAYFAIHSRELVGMAGQYLQPEIVAKIAVGGAVFLVVLIVVSLISVKLSDVVVDSAAGAFDRTLGFFYGLGRGLVLVVIAYLFYGWLIPIDRQEDWVKNARSLPIIQSVGSVILDLVPPDIAETLTNSSILTNQTPAQQPPAAQTGSGETQASPSDEEGYKKNESQGLDQLIQGTQGSQDNQNNQNNQNTPPPDNQEQPDFGGQTNPN
ncbi:CvpA family protein [Taklimakanibacter deserti]|uniref:CvpA family protein n=1 Tax=Taklimakanibacter deserti TaxID=2267839 RepID=UPI000E65294C